MSCFVCSPATPWILLSLQVSCETGESYFTHLLSSVSSSFTPQLPVHRWTPELPSYLYAPRRGSSKEVLSSPAYLEQDFASQRQKREIRDSLY